MIGFGELRKKSLEWQMELGAVEKIYALDWLLKGFYDRPALADALVLRDASALSKAYFLEYPPVDTLEFARVGALADEILATEAEAAVQDAAQVSGLHFRLEKFRPWLVRVEFTGPLGRRSAAQPLLVARLIRSPFRLDPVHRPLQHPFRDECAAIVRAPALEELAAERFVRYLSKPRPRDTFDLWFILTRGASEIDRDRFVELAQRIAGDKQVALRVTLDAHAAAGLEQAWEDSLKQVQPHPPPAQAQSEIKERLAGLGF